MLELVENNAYPQSSNLPKPEVLRSNATTQLLNRTLLLTIAEIREDFFKLHEEWNSAITFPLVNSVFTAMLPSYGVRLKLQQALLITNYLDKILEKEFYQNKIFNKDYIFSQIPQKKIQKDIFSLVSENIEVDRISPDIIRTLSCHPQFSLSRLFKKAR